MSLVLDQSLDLLTSSPVLYHCATDATLYQWKCYSGYGVSVEMLPWIWCISGNVTMETVDKCKYYVTMETVYQWKW